MDSRKRHDLVLAVCEVATNSVRHADGRGVLRVWQDGQVLVCEVADRGRPERPLAGRAPPTPGQQGGYGLWIAERLCDHVETLTKASGTVIRLHMRLG
jgi:anti-sigma regulatory factor (Ser/Thr protein kinase)